MTRPRRPSRAVLALLATGAVACGAPAAPAAPGRFPQPPAAATATVWAVGDGAIGSDAARAVAGLVEAGRPAAFLYLGDVYEYGTAADYAANYDTVYGDLTPITLPTPGNHEWGNRREGYLPYWRARAAGTPPPFYAVSLAGWRILSLNSEAPHDAGSAQMRWLRTRLRAPGTCRLAFWHRPRFSAGVHGDSPDLAPLWNALRGHASLVLNGHEHDMQVLRRRDGITALVAGAGGRNHYPVDRGDPRLAWGDDRNDGALRLQLEPGRARYAFVSAAGRVLRSGTVTCRTAT